MDREARVLLVGGAILLAVAAGWSRLRAPEPHASLSILARAAPPGVPSAAILFSPEDCGSLIESLRLWNGADVAGRLTVRGFLVIPAGSTDQIRKIVRGAALRFTVTPVSASEAAAFRRDIGYRGESLIVLFDSAGRVRHSIPLASLTSPGARAHALELAEELRAP